MLRYLILQMLAVLLLSGVILADERNEENDYVAMIPLVEAELFEVDAAHSYLGFSIGFLGLNKVRGHFNRYEMAILYNEADDSKLSVTMSIDAKSIDTRMRMRDKDLQSEKFFAAEQYPNIIFQSNKIEMQGDVFQMSGDLTMRGITKAIEIPLRQTVQRQKDLGWQNVRIGFEGMLTINRKDFGIDGGRFWGNKALSDSVTIEFNILGNKFNLDKFSFRSGNKPTVGDTLWHTVLNENSAAALEFYHRLRKKQPDDYAYKPHNIMLIGRRLVNRGDLDNGIEFIQIGLAEAPENLDGHLALGEAYALKGNREQAIAHYKKAQEISPEAPAVMEMLRHLEK